jgi:hypothetical protein
VLKVERGSDKHSVRLDEQVKHEVSGMVRSGRTTHAEEWKDPEPSGEDQPDVDRAPDATMVGAVPEGTTADDIEGRSELAAALGKEVWPATADTLAACAKASAAPDRVLDLLGGLPADRTYRNVQEVWVALGGGAEQHRF